MNYRHLYHAGNIGDVVKHVTLLALLAALRQKPTPFFVLDSHAGCGRYDLQDAAAQKTAEAADGVQKLLAAGKAYVPEAYLVALALLNPGLLADGTLEPTALRWYPGSPWLITQALRPDDRYCGCELHPEDFSTLRQNMPRQPFIQLHQRDGYEALGAFTPPTEKRGLIFIDPPFEQPDEFDRMADAVIAAHGRWSNGIYALWYPIKDRPAQWAFQEKMAQSGIRKQLLLEYCFASPPAPGLQGSGLLVINPPWGLAEAMAETYAKLHQALQGAVAETKIAWLVPE